MPTRPPVVLILATTPWPLSARLAMRIIAHGCRVVALCPRGHVLHKISGMEAIYSYWHPGSISTLLGAVARARPDIIVPCDDRAVWQLHELHESRPDLRKLIETSIGAAGFFRTVSSRAELMETARSMGLRVPVSRTIRSEQDIHSWFRDVPGAAVVKMDGTWGGSGVAFVESPEQAIAAWRRFDASQPLGSALKRWLINRDPLAFWARVGMSARGISMQKFIRGRSANAMASCWRGAVLGSVSVEVLDTQGPTGASTIVRLIQNDDIVRAVNGLVKGLGLSGFCGLDFILEEDSAAAYLIELNARCTQLGHLVLPCQGDLAGLLCEKLGAGESRPQAPIERDTIAFFPQALAWNPDSPAMTHCHHDVPWSEPALVRELLLEPWAERRWLSRLYHRMRGKRSSPLPSAGNFSRLAEEYRYSSGAIGNIVK